VRGMRKPTKEEEEEPAVLKKAKRLVQHLRESVECIAYI
jgi:hypothetical protein